MFTYYFCLIETDEIVGADSSSAILYALTGSGEVWQIDLKPSSSDDTPNKNSIFHSPGGFDARDMAVIAEDTLLLVGGLPANIDFPQLDQCPGIPKASVGFALGIVLKKTGSDWNCAQTLFWSDKIASRVDVAVREGSGVCIAGESMKPLQLSQDTKVLTPGDSRSPSVFIVCLDWNGTRLEPQWDVRFDGAETPEHGKKSTLPQLVMDLGIDNRMVAVVGHSSKFGAFVFVLNREDGSLLHESHLPAQISWYFAQVAHEGQYVALYGQYSGNVQLSSSHALPPPKEGISNGVFALLAVANGTFAYGRTFAHESLTQTSGAFAVTDTRLYISLVFDQPDNSDSVVTIPPLMQLYAYNIDWTALEGSEGGEATTNSAASQASVTSSSTATSTSSSTTAGTSSSATATTASSSTTVDEASSSSTSLGTSGELSTGTLVSARLVLSAYSLHLQLPARP